MSGLPPGALGRSMRHCERLILPKFNEKSRTSVQRSDHSTPVPNEDGARAETSAENQLPKAVAVFFLISSTHTNCDRAFRLSPNEENIHRRLKKGSLAVRCQYI